MTQIRLGRRPRWEQCIVRKRGLVWNGSTPLGQRFFGIDFGWFAIGVLLDGPEADDAR